MNRLALLMIVASFIGGFLSGGHYERSKYTEELVAIQAQNEAKLKELSAKKDETITLILKIKLLLMLTWLPLLNMLIGCSTTSVAPIESSSGMPQELLQSQSKRVDNYSQRVQDFIKKALDYSETLTHD